MPRTNFGTSGNGWMVRRGGGDATGICQDSFLNSNSCSEQLFCLLTGITKTASDGSSPLSALNHTSDCYISANATAWTVASSAGDEGYGLLQFVAYLKVPNNDTTEIGLLFTSSEGDLKTNIASELSSQLTADGWLFPMVNPPAIESIQKSFNLYWVPPPPGPPQVFFRARRGPWLQYHGGKEGRTC